MKTLDNGVIVFLRYARGEAPEVSLTRHTADGRREVYNYEGDADAFSEIGCYTALIDSKTGEAVRLLSAADGKG
jgi:hypothetical protein